MVDDIHTTVGDVHVTVQGDLGLVTCWMDQDYTLEGTRQHVSAPITVAFRRDAERMEDPPLPFGAPATGRNVGTV